MCAVLRMPLIRYSLSFSLLSSSSPPLLAASLAAASMNLRLYVYISIPSALVRCTSPYNIYISSFALAIFI